MYVCMYLFIYLFIYDWLTDWSIFLIYIFIWGIIGGRDVPTLGSDQSFFVLPNLGIKTVYWIPEKQP